MPINWIAGAALLMISGALCVVVLAYVIAASWFRRALWPREVRRRRSLLLTVANVERCERITEAGHCDLVISFSPNDSTNYREVSRWKLRTTARLPQEAFDRVEATRSLPIRFDPSSKNSIVIDLEPILGEGAEAFQRTTFIERGALRWKIA